MDEQSSRDRTSDNAENTAATSRRTFLVSGAAAAAAATLLGGTEAEARRQSRQSNNGRRPGPLSEGPSFLEIVRVPDAVTVYDHFERTMPLGRLALARSGDRWTGARVEVQTRVDAGGLALTLNAPAQPVAVVHVRWNCPVQPDLLVLGDAWERSYGELAWRSLVPERVLPWYFATWDDKVCHGYGVQTDARALCFWQLDPEGVSLWLNVTNGGNGVELGERTLAMATVIAHRGQDKGDSFTEVTALCRSLCARPTRKLTPIYGANDWDYSYGASTAETILRDTEFTAGLAPSGAVRPFSVIDGGWENGTAAWPDMGKLAAGIRQHNVRPGIWIRPLEAPQTAAPGLLLSGGRAGERKDRSRELAYDPTVPEAREKIAAKVRQVRQWGYELVKHDFSTYDLLGQWGFEMGPQPTVPGWSLADRSQTNAEVIASLYALIRESAGESMLIDGCNTVGHLGQGVFEMQRTGDDTSGHQWERTRRMGVNTTAFRLPQNGVFYTIDPDMVGITKAIPWEMNRQWLDMLARSGAVTIVAADPTLQGPDQKAAIRDAFAIAAAGGVGARPLDWMETTVPGRWRATADRSERNYNWCGAEGASPFLAP